MATRARNYPLELLMLLIKTPKSVSPQSCPTEQLVSFILVGSIILILAIAIITLYTISTIALAPLCLYDQQNSNQTPNR